MSSLAVDLGGTYLRCGVATDDGRILAVRRSRIRNFLGGVASEEIWAAIVGEIEGYSAGATHLGPRDPIAFAFPGPIVEHRRIVAAPTVVGRDARIPDLAAALESRTGRPVLMLNDVSAAAWFFSDVLAVDRFMVVTVSSGIGAKLFDRKRAEGVIDDIGYAGELGHSRTDFAPDAPVCDCGERGHLGAIASGRGTERLAQRRASEDPVAFARSACVVRYGATANTLTNETHLKPAILDDDPWALDVMVDAMKPLACAISAAVYAAGLEQVVVIGGFALSLGDRYIRALQRLVLPAAGSDPFLQPADDFVMLASMQPDACLLGAGAFARRVSPVFK